MSKSCFILLQATPLNFSAIFEPLIYFCFALALLSHEKGSLMISFDNLFDLHDVIISLLPVIFVKVLVIA